MTRDFIISTIKQGSIATLVIAGIFVLLEPAISYGNQITISQTVTAEVAFATVASDVVMSPSIGGITGGTSNGSTQFAITSNDVAGFRVTVQATTSDGRMVGNASSSNSISGYTTSVPGVPDKTFAVNNASGSAFGYTVDATTTTDVPASFKYTGSTCGGAGATNGGLTYCWIAATSTPYTIINRSMPTFNGIPASSTIAFRVMINANPNPTIPNDTYVATTTLTAIAN